MKIRTLCLFLTLACTALAQDALYKLKFEDAKCVTFSAERDFSIYPLSERAKPIVQANTKRVIIAADYLVGIKIKTDDPANAAQEILGQIAKGIGQEIGPLWNSALRKAEPASLLTGVGKTSTWSIFITPVGGRDYLATVSYVIEGQG